MVLKNTKNSAVVIGNTVSPRFTLFIGSRKKCVPQKPYIMSLVKKTKIHTNPLRGLSQITFALRVGRWSEKHVVYYIKSAN